MKRSYFHFVLYSLSFIFPQSYIVLHKTFKVANIDKLNHLHSKCSCCKSMELTLLLQFTFTATCYITASSGVDIVLRLISGAIKTYVGMQTWLPELNWWVLRMDSWRLEVGVLNMGPQIKMSEIAQSMEWYCISCLLNICWSPTHLVTPKLCNIMLYGCAYQDLQCPKNDSCFMK